MTTGRRWLSVLPGAIFIAIALQPTACMSWQAQRGTPQEAIASAPTAAVVVEVNGQSWKLTDPALVGDSIVGMVTSGSSGGEYETRLAIPTANVKQIKLYKFDTGLTLWLVAGIGATAVLIASIVGEPEYEPLPHGPTNIPPDAPNASCPIVYSWDGHRWRRDSGTFGGAIAASLSRTDADNLDFASPSGGVLRLRVTNELDEDDHIDAISVLAVDHDPLVTVAPDPAGRLHTILHAEPPIEARDFAGGNVLPRIQSADGWGWESSLGLRDTVSQVRDGVVLTFQRSVATDAGKLVIDGNNTPWAASMLATFIAAHGTATQAWYDSLSAFPMLARATQGALAREAFLTVSVWKQGMWESQGIVWEAGPEVVKRQVMPLDLHGVSGDSVMIRLESIPGFWNIDHVALDLSADAPIHMTEMSAFRAVDQNGRDVRDLIGRIDTQEYVTGTGDAAELSFRVPVIPTGKARSYVLKSSGWYHVHTPETGEPQVALLSRIGHEPDALSRIATARFDSAVLAARAGIR